MVETQTGRRVKTLRLDNGGEYTSDPFFQAIFYCSQNTTSEWSSKTHEPHIGGESPMYAITFGTKQSVLGRGIKLCSSYY